ncbi:MAG: hypothetical protein J6W06_09075 [Bacteroidales bacterium]|nr:hypothetical protein [Bacteroidales bacterium]
MAVCLLIFILVATTLCSCSTKSEEPVQEKYVASFGNEKLTERELMRAIGTFANGTDSAELADEYIDGWLTERIMYSEASKLLYDTAEINRKAMQYRRQLFVHEYCSKYIYSNVNMNVTEKEINDYYDNHLNEYVINTTYIKAHYMTISPKLTKYYEIFEKIRKSTPDDEQELGDYCDGPDKNIYFVKEWVELNDFVKLINFSGNIEPYELKYKNTLDFIYDTLRYLVKIDDYIVPGDLLPIELAKPRIIQIIMNKRRHDKYLQNKQELLSKYKSDGIIVIGNK